MGLFSSKTKINVDVVTNPLIDKEDRQEFTKTAIIKGTTGGAGVTNALLESAINGYTSKVDSFWRKHRSSEHLRLPRGQGFSIQIDETETQQLVERVIGEPVEITMNNYSSHSAYFYAQYYVQENYGLNINTGKIENTFGDNADAEYYFKTAEFDVIIVGTTVTEALSRIIISYEERVTDDQGTVTTTDKTKIIEYPYNTSDRAFLIAYYYLVSDPDQKTRIFIRPTDAELYDIGNHESFSRLESYLPLVTIRKEKENTADTISPDEKTALNSALSHIGLDLDEITDAIMTTDNGNDPEQMHDVFLMFAADLHSECEETIEYLAEYFEDLSHTQIGSKANYESWWNNGAPTGLAPKQTRLRIVQDNFDVNLVFNYIHVETKTGALPEKIEREFHVEQPHSTTISSWFGLEYELEEVDRSYVIFRRRISANSYVEVTVHGPVHIHEVYENHIAIRNIENSLDLATNNEDDKSFFLPVSRDVLRKIPGLRRNYVVQDCLSITVYAVQKTKVKWYERGIFKWVLLIVLIIVAVWTGQWQLPTTWAAAGTAAVNLLIGMVVGALLGVILKPVLIEVIEALGLEGTLILVVIAVVLSLVFKMDLVSLTADIAISTVSAATSIADAFSAAIGEMFADLQMEMEALLSGMREFEKEIEDIYDLLGGNTGIDYYAATEQNRETFLETPGMFFTRTLNPNPGVMVFDAITNFVEMKLQLPKYQMS